MVEKESPTMIATNKKLKYSLLTTQDVLAEIKKITNEVNEILNLPSTTLVRLLLNHFKWNKDSLIEKFYDDPDRLFDIIKVANPTISPSVQWDPTSPGIMPNQAPMLPTKTSTPILTCHTCQSEFTTNEIFALRCRHPHCFSCWQGYLKSNIVTNGCKQSIPCPSRCKEVIDDQDIIKLLGSDAQLCQRYQDLLVESFVQSNRLTRWCPGNNCSMIIKMKKYDPDCSSLIECDKCQTVSCFQCGKPWHEPVLCEVLQRWEKKNQDESMNGSWILANTKECPKCHSSIEKNGGCNHMTCRKIGCGHEFCWLCFADWKEHKQCNVYRQQEIETTQSSARDILKRYMHYFERYQEHDKSLKFEENLRQKVEERVREMQANSMSYTEQQSIGKAFECLQQCRRTLKYTYPFAYYLQRTGTNLPEIFENNQADLERATEVLSGFLDNEIQADSSKIIDLMNKTSYCAQRRQILLDNCKDGYEKDYWKILEQ